MAVSRIVGNALRLTVKKMQRQQNRLIRGRNNGCPCYIIPSVNAAEANGNLRYEFRKALPNKPYEGSFVAPTSSFALVTVAQEVETIRLVLLILLNMVKK